MSDSSQFFASSTEATNGTGSKGSSTQHERIFPSGQPFDYRQGIRLCNQIRSGQASDSGHGGCTAAIGPVQKGLVRR
jgi:hypothetical protein